MTDRKNLFAYTELPSEPNVFVGYLSLNREPDGRVTLTVRERGDGNKHATIELPAEQVAKMAVDLGVAADILATEQAFVDHMVNRFLGWKLPDNFSPDGGVTFNRPAMGWPTGTNLLNALQARDMLQYLLRP